MHLFLTFSAALGNMSKLYCTRLHENFLVYSVSCLLKAHSAYCAVELSVYPRSTLITFLYSYFLPSAPCACT